MFLVMTFYHDFLSNSLHVFHHDFLSWLSIKQSSCFSSWLSIMTFYQTVFMFLVITFYHNSLSNSLYVSCHDFLSWLSIKQSSCFSSWLSIKSFYQIVFMFFIMTLYQMQKDNAKKRKISIFNFLDIKLKFLMNQVKLTRFLVESSHVKLKICLIQLKSSWKCKQLNFESSWIQNVNLKLDLIISLIMTWSNHWKESLIIIIRA